MNAKFLFVIITIVIFTTISITVVYAKGLNSICSKQNIVVTLKDDVDVDKAKGAILEIPKIKIIKITDRNKEWSKMVNKYDLPKMENPFKNQFILKVSKNAHVDETINKIKEMSFVEQVGYAIETKECKGK